MADVRQRTTLGNWFRYGLRFLGVTGLFAAFFGLVFFYFNNPRPNSFAALQTQVETAWQSFGNIEQNIFLIGVLGATLAAIWLLLELLMGLVLVTGSRAAVGGNVYAQIGLAAVVFLVVNAVAFRNYSRYDLTRNKLFTLPDDLVKELRTLSNESPTDVVVLRLHKTAIARGEDADNVDKAAENKIVEKVNDLVDQLRELGPRFRVTVLDKQDEYIADKIDKLPPALRNALKNVPEDSIFFHANGRVRRMSFEDFYRVDKTASRKEDEVTTPDGLKEKRVRSVNLVLMPQGRDEFVRRLLSLEQKTPRIGLVAIHPELSTRETSDELSSAGLRKFLEKNGFEVVDILVKKWDRRTGPQPAALTYEEFELDRMENEFNLYSLLAQDRELAVKQLTEVGKTAQTMSLPELDRRFRRAVGRPINTEQDRTLVLEALRKTLEVRNEELKEFRDGVAEREPKYKALLANEKAGEGRRVSDMQAKLRAAVNDCDLLIVPRLTSMDLAKGYAIRPTFYTLSKEQAEAIKDYIKSGKPVMACFGPSKMGPSMEAEPDDVEKLFERLGVEFGQHTVLTEVEGRAAASRQGDGLGGAVEVPALVFDKQTAGDKKPNPITNAYTTAARRINDPLELHKSGPRPMGVNVRIAAKSAFAAPILSTVKESWNEERPIPDDDYIPKFEATKFDDPKRGTPEEERRGPFTVGVALETKVPAEWFDEKLDAARTATSIGAAAGGLGLAATSLIMDAENFAAAGTLPERPTVRIVAYGHGGLFTGKDLSPAQEQLLLHTLNWQLKRDDLLPKGEVAPWQFPRVEMSEQKKKLWQIGTFLGLPMLCGYAGLLVLMTRKLR